jgi:hypothetical protein
VKGFNIDDFVKNPISALRFIPQSLRRTLSTPHSTGFARLELGLFTKSSSWISFYEFINGWPTGRAEWAESPEAGYQVDEP